MAVENDENQTPAVRTVMLFATTSRKHYTEYKVQSEKTVNIKNWLRRIIAIIIVLLFAIAAVYVFQNAGTETIKNNKLQVVASANFWGDIAAQIGGDHVQVMSIINDPSIDPHLYESDAKAAAAVSRADIIIKNGLGYDDFIDKLLSVSSNNDRRVLSADSVMGASSGSNPHLWYDISRVTLMANAIEREFSAQEPTNASFYAMNLTTFTSSLQSLNATVNEIKTKYPHVPIAYTERVPQYLIDAAGLDDKTPSGFASAIEEGNDPSPNDTAIMKSLMTNHSIRALLYNAQATSSVTKQVQDLAKSNGIPVIGVTETLPSNEPAFQTWQIDQAKALLMALGG